MALAYGASLGTPNKSTATATTTIAFTTSVTVPSGGHLVVAVSWYNFGVTATVAGGGLTWTQDVLKTGSSDVNYHLALFSAPAPAGLASSTTITATFSASAFGRAIFGDYWTGVATSSPKDQTSTAGGATTGWSGGSQTTTNANDLIVAAGWGDVVVTTNTPTSPATEVEDFNVASDRATWAMEYRIVAATSTYSLAGTWGGTPGEWLGVQVSYKAAGGGSSFSQSATDTLAIAESLARTLTLPRALSDTIGIAESLTRAVALPRPVTDALAIAESVSRSLGHTVTATDAIAISESLARSAQAFTRTATDAVAVAEALTRSVNYPRSVTDALAISDVAARSAALHPRALTDTVTVVDNATSNGGGTPVSGLPPQVPVTGAGT